MEDARKIDLHAVVFRSGDWWICQCLEHDIGVQARTMKDLRRKLEHAIVGHIVVAEDNGLEPFAILSRAPERYWKMFEAGWKLENPESHTFTAQGRSRPVPTPEMRVSEQILEPA